jgi:hypothetical protein
MDDQYLYFAQMALQILEIKNVDSTQLDPMINVLRRVMLLPITETERNIVDICIKIADRIEARSDPVEILGLLDLLKSEATYNLLD